MTYLSGHLSAGFMQPGPGAQDPAQPPNKICLVKAAEKKKYSGHSSKKDNHPGPFPQQGFCISLQI